MANVPHPPSGLNALATRRLTPRLAKQLGFGPVGCAWRGSLYCEFCPAARRLPIVCDWQCWKCDDRWRCPCGHDTQTVRVDSWFGLGLFEEV